MSLVGVYDCQVVFVVKLPPLGPNSICGNGKGFGFSIWTGHGTLGRQTVATIAASRNT